MTISEGYPERQSSPIKLPDAATTVTFLSHTAMGGKFVVGSHHLAAELVAAGYNVSHVSAPVSLGHLISIHSEPFVRTRVRRWWKRGASIRGVLDFAPVTLLPWSLARRTGIGRWCFSNLMLVQRFQGVSTLRLEQSDFVIVDEPRFVGLIKKVEKQVLVYRATDLNAAMRDDPSILDAEIKICKIADLVVATSSVVAAHLNLISGRSVHVITNGVEFEHFACPKYSVNLPNISLPGKLRAERAIYVGAFDVRFGASELQQAAVSMPEKKFILVGPNSESYAVASGLPNVVGIGPIDYASLPYVLSQCSVGLIPLSNHAANNGRSPMKLYEYVAAGLTVAATCTDELLGRKLSSLSLTSATRSFAEATQEAFERSLDLDLLLAARKQAKDESWSRKALQLISLGRP